MRLFVLSLVTLLTVYSCKQQAESYTIHLDLEGLDGKWITLMSRVNREYVVTDSVLVESGVPAVLSSSLDGVQTMYLAVKGERKSIRLLMENADYTISGTMDNPVIVSSGQAQTDLNSYNDAVVEIDNRLSAIVQEYYLALENEEQARADSILAQYEIVNSEKNKLNAAYVAENPASFATVLVLRGTFYELETDELERTLNSLDQSVRQMEEFKYMYGIMEKQKEVAPGKPYKDFALESPDGEMLSVSDVHKGNVLLIDFWASWCGPCRRANPGLVKIYNDYHDQGFDILGVSLDSDTASWLKAIEDDQLIWNHISDVKGWDCEGSKLYGVPAIPHAVLIDREGIIYASKLEGDELRQAIESLL